MRQAATALSLFAILLSPSSSAAQVAEATFSAHYLRWAVNIELMKGHLVSSLENLRVGEKALSLVHASHPVSEQFDFVAPPLRARSPGFEIRVQRLLIGLQEKLDGGVQAMEYERILAQMFAVLDQALKMLVPGDILAEPGFQAAVISHLCQIASHEYHEGVHDGRVVTVVEYQDAYGFVQRAQALANNNLKGQLPAAVFDLLSQMAEAFPSVTPPERPLPPAKVSAAAQHLTQAISGMAGEHLSAEVEPEREIAAIRNLLGQIQQAYRIGEVRRAKELTALMYLDHFEKIEGDLIDKALELNNTLEPILGMKIRQLIIAKAPPEEVESVIAQALPALAEAEKVLTKRSSDRQ